MTPLKDLTGSKFGRLLVLNIVPERRNLSAQWLCKCDCGNTIIVITSRLNNGNTTSCGCYKKDRIREKNLINLSGKKFGKLLVIERKESSKTGQARWLCQCDCGNKRIIFGNSLRKGRTKSCGCLRKTKIGIGTASFNSLFRRYKKHAKKRNLTFNLSKKLFKQLINSDCFYCGRKPFQIIKSKYNSGNYIYNGIDRLDSSKGYFAKNCVTCCKQCNRAKTDMSVKDFYDWIKIVYERINK